MPRLGDTRKLGSKGERIGTGKRSGGLPNSYRRDWPETLFEDLWARQHAFPKPTSGPLRWESVLGQNFRVGPPSAQDRGSSTGGSGAAGELNESGFQMA